MKENSGCPSWNSFCNPFFSVVPPTDHHTKRELSSSSIRDSGSSERPASRPPSCGREAVLFNAARYLGNPPSHHTGPACNLHKVAADGGVEPHPHPVQDQCCATRLLPLLRAACRKDNCNSIRELVEFLRSSCRRTLSASQNTSMFFFIIAMLIAHPYRMVFDRSLYSYVLI